MQNQELRMKKIILNSLFIILNSNNFMRAIFVGLGITLCFTVLAVQVCWAYFSDTKTASDNLYEAGILKFALDSENDFAPDLSATTLFSTRTINLEQTGTLDFQYNMRVIDATSSLCDVLAIKDDLTNTFVSLADYQSATTTLAIKASWNFTLQLSNTNSSYQNETCIFKFIIDAWQTNLENNSHGFTHQEILWSSIKRQSDIVLNEFLPHPTGLNPDYGFDFGTDSSQMPQGEWVELYNSGSAPVNVFNWHIEDAGPNHIITITSENTNTSSTMINSGDWLVVYLNHSVFNNTGDIVTLYNSSGILIDSYVYDTSNACFLKPTPGEDNPSTGSGQAATSTCSVVPGNKSYARIPDGIGPWYDPIPTPGLPNRMGEGGVKEIKGTNEEKGGEMENDELKIEDQELLLNSEFSIPNSTLEELEMGNESSTLEN